jgi:hypothetical protein
MRQKGAPFPNFHDMSKLGAVRHSAAEYTYKSGLYLVMSRSPASTES